MNIKKHEIHARSRTRCLVQLRSQASRKRGPVVYRYYMKYV
jgi:hypothetical protein